MSNLFFILIGVALSAIFCNATPDNVNIYICLIAFGIVNVVRFVFMQKDLWNANIKIFKYGLKTIIIIQHLKM